MAPRASWKGYLKLSLVSCPVRLYTATSSSERIAFNMLHKDTRNRVQMKPVDPELGQVERSDLVKGYQYEKNQYVILDADDFDKVKIESTETITIEAFVDIGEIDEIYHASPYYLTPDGAMAEETFVVIRQAMAKSKKAAIARIVLSGRERIVAITIRDRGMLLTTLRNPKEVRGYTAYFETIPADGADKEMLKLAQSLIEQKAGAFEPEAYKDRYEEALMEVIRAKIAGEEPVVAAAPERGKVINLMDALKKSLEGAETAGQKQKPPGGGAKDQKEDRLTGVQMTLEGAIFVIVGALEAFPKRLAGRVIADNGGTLRRRLSRRVDTAVFGHKLIETRSREAIEHLVIEAEAHQARPISEYAFLDCVGLLRQTDTARQITGSELVRQSGLPPEIFRYLALFDAFEFSTEPFGFRDIVAARQFAKLLDDGLRWPQVIGAVRTRTRAAQGGVSNARLMLSRWNSVVMRAGKEVTELDGQHILPLPPDADPDPVDAVFAKAEAAEADNDWGEAITLYKKCSGAGAR